MKAEETVKSGKNPPFPEDNPRQEKGADLFSHYPTFSRTIPQATSPTV